MAIGRPVMASQIAGESLTHALRQLALYGRDGLPVLAADGQHLQGWITTQDVLHAVQQRVSASGATTVAAQLAAEWASPDSGPARREPPDPLDGYQLLEITIAPGSPAAGHALREATWPPGSTPVSVRDNHALRDPDPAITLNPGDRVSLLA